MKLSIIIPYIENSPFIEWILEDIKNKIKTEHEVIILWWPEGTNFKWNLWVKQAIGEYIWIINDDIVLTEWLDSELIKGLETHKIACPYTTSGNNKWQSPMFDREDMIAGWCFMIKRKDWVPIPKQLDIYFWDNWVYEKMNHSVFWGWKVHHYESKSINDPKHKEQILKRIENDKKNWKKICKTEWFWKITSNIKLSILIPSIPLRNRQLGHLLKKLEQQTNEEIEIIAYVDNKKITVWEKRNRLLELANWEYCVMIDDDDDISNDYIEELMKWIKTNADVICYQVICSINWWEDEPVLYSKNLENKNFPEYYTRKPNHLMCYKTELARKVKYKDTSYWEDTDYSERITPLIKTEYQIDKVLYYYDYQEKKSETFNQK